MLKYYFLCTILVFSVLAQYKPDWNSIDSRPLPSWYDDSKFGIFIHWGVFSVPSFGCSGTAGEWYWWGLSGSKSQCIVDFHNRTYGPDFKYADFAPMFKAELFDANKWATLFQQSGAKYVVLTSKHHDGFCNWPSAESWNWNSVDTGPHQDNVGLITAAVRSKGLKMGLYHSLFEWFNPLYLADRANKGSTTVYVDTVLQPMLRDIVNKYQPEVIWSDGDWEMSDTYWKSTEFLAWLYNDSPVKDTVVVNDRWGIGDACHHGGYYTCNDRYNPGKLQNHKWENCFTIDKSSWGFNRNTDIEGYISIEELIGQLVSTVACGGNFLLNVGPTSYGAISPVYEERLLQVGQWLSINGESIYQTKPWRVQNDTSNDLWYVTTSAGTVYCTILNWPSNNVVTLASPKTSSNTVIHLLGYSAPLTFTSNAGKIVVNLPYYLDVTSQWAWVLKLTNVS
eukprot:TRINITY_DN921_c0_g1_i1.p1 TRINITY_DN921_c0_g1~~TRINITY_DN921_c0_g1_i1.p1  ORF type:complete len:451 (-),score=63.65 TRINITY_DN921_c0_g1_i1:35-1387(-)